MAEAFQGIMVVAEAALAIAMAAEGYKSLSIARDYYNLYKDQREFYYTTFQAGVEAPLSAEALAIPAYVRNYATRIATVYDNTTGVLAGEATDVEGWIARHRVMYGAPEVTRIDDELETDRARIESDWVNYFFRFEEHVYDVENDIRWRKRMAIHNIGLKQGTAIAGALDQSLTGFQEQLNGLGDQLATYGNGIARYVGYKRGLSDTSDDFASRLPQSTIPDYNYTMPGQLG